MESRPIHLPSVEPFREAFLYHCWKWVTSNPKVFVVYYFVQNVLFHHDFLGGNAGMWGGVLCSGPRTCRFWTNLTLQKSLLDV